MDATVSQAAKADSDGRRFVERIDDDPDDLAVDRSHELNMPIEAVSNIPDSHQRGASRFRGVVLG